MSTLYLIENKVSPYYDNTFENSNYKNKQDKIDIIIDKINLEENNILLSNKDNNKEELNKNNIYCYKIINIIKKYKINIIFSSIILSILLISFLLYIFIFKK